MPIFTAGIVWDPREPLPPELTLGGQSHVACCTTNTNVLSVNPPSSNDDNNILPGGPVKRFPDHVLKESTRNLLSPLSVSINGRIVDDTAQVIVSQIFWNNADIPIPKASYVFPLPSGCTVTGFTCRVGRDKIIRAKVKPKAEAQDAFQKAVAAQRTAALLEQNTPELFTTSLGNIPANTRLEAELTYVTLLKRQFSQEKNITTFTIPTAIANRYGSAPPDIGENLTRETPQSLTLQLEVTEAEKIVHIKSDSHKILLDQGLDKGKSSNWTNLSGQSQESRIDVAVIKLDSEAGFLREDFILTIETSSPSKADHAHAWLESHPSLENQKAMMIMVPSSLMLESKETHKTGEVIFLADRSGSMKDKIDALKSSLKFFLKGIPVGRKFNIWSFGSRYEKLWANSQDYNSESLQIALDYVESQFKANMGGTELLNALDAMINSRDKSCPCDVIILTDGEVWRLEETLKLVQDTRTSSSGEVRFFSLGIGAHVSHALVQGIASRGGGYCEVIPKASMGGWEDRVVAMLKAALTTHVNTWSIKLDGKGDYGLFLASPADFGNLNAFQGNRIYILSTPDSPLDQLTSISIETLKSNGDRQSTTISVTTLKQPDTIIHNLAAQAIVDDGGYPGKQTLSPTQATELACRFSIVSKWTSFFLEQENPESKEEDQDIPVHDATNDLDLLQPRGTTRHPTTEPIGHIKRYSVDASPSSNFVDFDFDYEFASRPTNALDFCADPTDGFDSRPGNFLSSTAQLQFQGFSYSGPKPRSNNNLEAGNESKLPRIHCRTTVQTTSWEVIRPRWRRSYAKRAPGSTSLMPPMVNFPVQAKTVSSKMHGPFSSVNIKEEKKSKHQVENYFDSLMSTTPEPKLDGTAFNDDSADSHKKFVAKLLWYQNFDGSINTDASSILGSLLTTATHEVEEYALKTNTISSSSAAGILAYTVVFVVLLERDLLDCKDLWDLMRIKAVDYIVAQVPDESKRTELYKFAQEHLAGKQLPLSGASADSTDQATANPEDASIQEPERSEVKVAPIE
ncbi:VIT-domain-containing protein [Annulohypoxylon bovei var. microspora]|nr:VIT-domain-containing protein [Annulohypoxylon bovei var. microspora]